MSLSNLYRGLQATIFGAFPIGFSYMFGYTYGSGKVREVAPHLNEVYVNMVGGGLAEICSNVVKCPFELTKQQMQIGLDSKIG